MRAQGTASVEAQACYWPVGAFNDSLSLNLGSASAHHARLGHIHFIIHMCNEAELLITEDADTANENLDESVLFLVNLRYFHLNLPQDGI